VTGIALLASELPAHLLEPVRDRIHERAGQPEVRFEWWQTPALLPVRWEGSLRLLPWGSKERRSRLPFGGLISQEQIAAGVFAHAFPEEAVIPANYGFHRGTWFLIEEGIRAVVLPDGPRVYVLVEPSTNYYRNMTGQSPLMPVLVNQRV
jgi:hypothetical protein